jgi:hypothetical protein
MKVLLDECLPKKLKRLLSGHEVSTVPEMGWAGIKNGALLRLAEPLFDVFITIDGNMRHQQNLAVIELGFIVLAAPDNSIDTLGPLMPQVLAVLTSIQPGIIMRVEF